MTTERLRMAEAAQLASPKTGAKVNEATVRRWASRGVVNPCGRRIFLQTERVGRRLYTTPMWLEEFIACCSEAEPPRSDRQRHKATDRIVLERLRAHGIKV